MFWNIESEITRGHINKTKLAKSLNISQSTLWSKLTHKTEFTILEAEKIKEILGSDLSIDELFERNK